MGCLRQEPGRGAVGLCLSGQHLVQIIRWSDTSTDRRGASPAGTLPAWMTTCLPRVNLTTTPAAANLVAISRRPGLPRRAVPMRS